jgi:VanZ family protein
MAGRVLWNWGPALAAMATIYSASSIPDLPALPGDVSDKTAHFAGYAVLGALVLRAVASARWACVTGRTAVIAWGISAAYGATDEFHQRFVPGRTPAFDDLVADGLGAALAIALLVVAAVGLRRGSGGV